MSRQQSAFDRQQIEESAVIKPPGLLEQFNLQPAVITFIRKNQRLLWIVTGCVALIVVAGALYEQYTSHRAEKASAALTLALQAGDDKKQELLGQVVAEYASTSAGLWARIELAHLAVEQGEVGRAIEEFAAMKKEVSAENPVSPLILTALGTLYEKNNELDKALATFTELSAYKGFEASSNEAMGRLYERQGKKEKALEMYRKALAANSEAELPEAPNPNRETIQARINYLQE